MSLRAGFVSAFVAIIAYVCLDYFFTAPLFTLGMNQTLDFFAPIGYITTAFVITRLISKVRSRSRIKGGQKRPCASRRAEMAYVTRVMTMREFTASFAHEINQPLSAIVNNGGACLRWLAGASPNLAS